jgi:integrase
MLSPEEVAHLIDSAQTRFHRIVLMTLYGTGVRRAELTRLQIPDIDSRRMVIHIRGGKGRQDRDVMEWDWTSALTLRDWREQTEAFEDVATVLRPERSRVTFGTNSGSEEIQGSIVSGNFFDLLRVRPLLGRAFSPSEAQRGENVTVLGYGM